MERSLRDKIYIEFIKMLLKKNRDWIFKGDSSFIVVRAKASGIYRRIPIYKPNQKLVKVIGESLFSSEFIKDDLFTNYPEHEAVRALYGIGIPYRDLDKYINIHKSHIYILPDEKFFGSENFEPLFKVQAHGNVEFYA